MTDRSKVLSRWLIPAAVLLIVGIGAVKSTAEEGSAARPRLVVLSDYFQDPDDKQSLIRLLLYANEFEIEGLIATSLSDGKGTVRPELIREAIDLYAQIYPSLRAHAREGFPYPEPEKLKSIVKRGAPVIRTWLRAGNGFSVPYPADGRDSRSCDPVEKWVGEGKATEASAHLVQLLEQDDPRPLWIAVWGGPMDLAQALWQVRHKHSAEASRRMISRIRYYQVSWQDTGAVWLWENFPELFRLQSQFVSRGIYREGPPALRDEAWLRANVVEHHGALGASYPAAGANGKHTLQVKEGDSASFLYLLAPGLSDPNEPEWGGWGGRFRHFDSTSSRFVDARDRNPSSDEVDRESTWTMGRWNEAIANDFAARMNWCVQPPSAANHPPVAHLDGDASRRVLRRTVRAGETIALTAAGTTDPDRDRLTYRWWLYSEPGTFEGELRLEGQDTASVTLVAPVVSTPATAHLILEVTDSGQPRLTSYRRIVLTFTPR